MMHYTQKNAVICCHVVPNVTVRYKGRKLPAGEETTMGFLLISGKCKGVSGSHSMN